MTRRTETATCPYCGGGHSKRYLCEAELEGWEIDYELRQKKDYAALVAHYEAIAEWSGDGLYQLGDAYVLNGEPEKAIELLTEPYREAPRFEVEDEHFWSPGIRARRKRDEAAKSRPKTRGAGGCDER